MARRKDISKNVPSSRPSKLGKQNPAFDEYVNRSLHTMFDGVAQEPIPEALIRLIEDSEKKKKKK